MKFWLIYFVASCNIDIGLKEKYHVYLNLITGAC